MIAPNVPRVAHPLTVGLLVSVVVEGRKKNNIVVSDHFDFICDHKYVLASLHELPGKKE